MFLKNAKVNETANAMLEQRANSTSEAFCVDVFSFWPLLPFDIKVGWRPKHGGHFVWQNRIKWRKTLIILFLSNSHHRQFTGFATRTRKSKLKRKKNGTQISKHALHKSADMKKMNCVFFLSKMLMKSPHINFVTFLAACGQSRAF